MELRSEKVAKIATVSPNVGSGSHTADLFVITRS